MIDTHTVKPLDEAAVLADHQQGVPFERVGIKNWKPMNDIANSDNLDLTEAQITRVRELVKW